MPEQQPTEGTAAAPADAERQEHARRRTRMVAAGFYDAAKSERWLDSPELAQVNTDALFAGLRWAPSPDIALPSLVRLIEKHPGRFSVPQPAFDRPSSRQPRARL